MDYLTPAARAKADRIEAALGAADPAPAAATTDALATAERATTVAERYGEALVAIGAALPDVAKVRRILAGLDSDT